MKIISVPYEMAPVPHNHKSLYGTSKKLNRINSFVVYFTRSITYENAHKSIEN